MGLKARANNPIIKGSVHAWIGIVCGSLSLICGGRIGVLVILWCDDAISGVLAPQASIIKPSIIQHRRGQELFRSGKKPTASNDLEALRQVQDRFPTICRASAWDCLRISMSRTRSAINNGGNPCCRVLNRFPGPRNCISSSASSKPIIGRLQCSKSLVFIRVSLSCKNANVTGMDSTTNSSAKLMEL